jgi:secreted trypsin-like serine protease
LIYRGFKLQYVVRPINEAEGEIYPETGLEGQCGKVVLPQEELPSTTEENTDEDAEIVAPSSSTESSRIVGNNTAPRNSLPWMVAMLIDGKSFCGGTIIDRKHILTAGKKPKFYFSKTIEKGTKVSAFFEIIAHCTNGAETITLLIGAHDIKAPLETEPSRRVVNITKDSIFTHPKYNEDNVFNDISIIRLPQELSFNSAVQPICLPTRRYLASSFDLAPVSVSGWGITADGGKISPELQQTDVTVLGNRECRQVFRDILTGNQICVKTTPKSSPCRGDSGGPLYLRQKDYAMQVGIVSFGTFTCERGFPVAFTRVTAFLDYINAVTGSKL